MSFLDVDITTDPDAMVDDAIDSLTTQFAGIGIANWAPADGDLEIILLNVLAQMAVDVALVAAQVPAAIFRKFGTDLVGVAFIQGAQASVLSTWTAVDDTGYTLPAGTYLTISGLGFYVQATTTISPGDTVADDVLLIAVTPSADYNGLTGPAVLVDAIDWVSSVVIIGTTSGGADAETDDEYQDRLSAVLALQAPRPITASDYATFVLSFPPASGTDQEEVGRAVAIDGYQADGTGTFTATTTNGSPTLTAVTGGVSANVGAGTAITGTGIPALTTILQNNGATILMSANATASATITVTATGLYNQERCVAVFIAAADGTALNADTLIAVKAWLQTYREVNFLIYVLSPTYTTIYVTFEIVVYPTADPDGTVESAVSALLAYLSPSGFGQAGTTNTSTAWINDTTVRRNKLIGIVESVTGVNYVTTMTLGTTAVPVGTTDVPVFGPAALIESTFSTIFGSHT